MGSKRTDYPPFMHDDGDRGGYVVRNPVSGKKKRFTEEKKARDTAKELAAWVDRERQIKALDEGRPTIASLVDSWMRDRLQFQPWDAGTKKNMLAKLNRIRRELGSRILGRTDCMFLEDWLTSFCKTGDQFNKWRYSLILLWKYALSRKLVHECEPAKIELRSTSKKLEMNQKVRRQLEIDGFHAIHSEAEPWLQLAMETSLVTLQARNEICHMQHAHFRDGFLFVIRDKVSGDSDMAFIKIALTPQLEEFRSRARALDSTVSPYLIHRKPNNERREWIKGKPHWTFINPSYLTKAFEKTRDRVERFAAMPAGQRPTFHEIRGLGSRLYLANGMAPDAIQSLMTHADRRTTQIYLDKGVKGLTDTDYIAVSAPLTFAKLMGKGGT